MAAEAASTVKEPSAPTAWYVTDVSHVTKHFQIKILTFFQTLNLRRPASASPFAQPRDYKRVLPSERLSAVFNAEDLEL